MTRGRLPQHLRQRYQCGALRISGDRNALFERHLRFDRIAPADRASMRDSYEALARALRDVLSQRWLRTERDYGRNKARRVYFLSMEYLPGRSLVNNYTNLQLESQVYELAQHHGIDLAELMEQEPDAGLGNGGLGRLAACFLDSMATLGIPAMGYGLRYEYGIFRQELHGGWQREQPDHWLARPDPWEIARPDEAVEVTLGCGFERRDGMLWPSGDRPLKLVGIPHDRPVVGYGGKTINTLRLWAAGATDFFDLAQFNSGDFVGALTETLIAETLTRVLYPDDSTMRGRALRFVQQYFLVACSLADILRRLKAEGDDWTQIADRAAIQLNDTHPTLAIPELMRLLVDEVRVDWDDAWRIVQKTFAYTNHTLLPEALEKWPVRIFELLLPRQLQIIYEINRRFLDQVRAEFPADEARVARVSLIEESPERRVRMANLAIVGSHSVNGVSALHTELLKRRVVADFAAMYPERFQSKTNGVTQRRFLLQANPALAGAITKVIGSTWITDLSQLAQLAPLAGDAQFQASVRAAKSEAKGRFCDWLGSQGATLVDPHSIFDTHIKRIHEYKRQLLNVLHIIGLYERLRRDPSLEITPRTFFFAGKAAPAYRFAKLVIKLISNVADVIDEDPVVSRRLRVIFITDYRVSVAERLIPASDVSEQLSTAGYEASGTSNMKFMMNGALTVGTRDGATVEMATAAGEENLFLFGLDAKQVEDGAGWYNPWWHYENEPQTRAVLDLISSDHFSRHERGIFAPIVDALLRQGDHYRHLADLDSYCEIQRRVAAIYGDPADWTSKVILNIAASGYFSSDRAISEYSRDIWRVTPVGAES
ncbi:MAG: glycogen/starch/alpha-glucan phosphorylase [Steroidobacteraceae bacterium]